MILKNANILVIDDDEDVLIALRLLLKSLVNNVVVNKNPNQIHSLLQKEHFDIVILDIMGAHEKGEPTWKLLFQMLGDYFDNRFGPRWKDEHEAVWNEFEKTYDNRQGHPAAAAA